MELTVLGSSSKGNCYIFSNDTEALIIECGVSFKEVKIALDFNIRKVVGALVSHSHLDHAGYVNDFLSARINVYLSHETDVAIRSRLKSPYLPLLMESGKKFKIGGFTVLPFKCKHDVHCLGFLINHEETGNVLFVTDSYYIPYNFTGLSNVLIECNYRHDILERNIEAGKITFSHYNRLLESHMSFETCASALRANDLSKVNNIILLHLSDGNSNAEEFKNDIHKETGKTVFIADKGLKLSLNKTPF